MVTLQTKNEPKNIYPKSIKSQLFLRHTILIMLTFSDKINVVGMINILSMPKVEFFLIFQSLIEMVMHIL